MSVDYYLLCKKHDEAVFIVSTNHSIFEIPELREFESKHNSKNECRILFVDEFELNDRTKIIGLSDDD